MSIKLDKKHKAILDVLSRYGEINATKIARLTGLHYRTVSKKLVELVEMGIVEERRFGRLRLFRIKGKLL